VICTGCFLIPASSPIFVTAMIFDPCQNRE
jgi:hypothetical protein